MLPRLHRYTHSLFAIICRYVEACATFHLTQPCQAVGGIESRCGVGDIMMHFHLATHHEKTRGLNKLERLILKVLQSTEKHQMFRHAYDQIRDTTRGVVLGIMLGQGCTYSWTAEEHRLYGMLLSFFLIEMCSYLLHG